MKGILSQPRLSQGDEKRGGHENCPYALYDRGVGNEVRERVFVHLHVSHWRVIAPDVLGYEFASS